MILSLDIIINSWSKILHVKFKALSMEEKDVNLWWDAIQYIVQKDIGKVRKKYKWNERLYRHKISQTEKVMPSFEYKPLILFPKLKTLNEEKDKGDTNGVGSSNIIIAKEPKDFRGRKNISKREVVEHIHCSLLWNIMDLVELGYSISEGSWQGESIVELFCVLPYV